MFIHFPSAVAVVLTVQLVEGVVHEVRIILSCKFAIGLKKGRFVHRPYLDWRLLFLAMVLAISSPSVWIKGIAIRMQIVPSCKFGCFNKISFVKSSMSAIRLVRETHWMLIEFGYWYHFIIISGMREVILNNNKDTP